jgi:hypothetical protein
MTPHARLAAIVGRISAATSVIRVRACDAERDENNGTANDSRERIERVITRLERVAVELEKSIA